MKMKMSSFLQQNQVEDEGIQNWVVLNRNCGLLVMWVENVVQISGEMWLKRKWKCFFIEFVVF